MPSQTYGKFGSRPSGQYEYLTLAFSPLSTPLRSRWRNNGLSADFLSDYVITFLPAASNDLATERLQQEMRQIVSYVTNELLENAMKYHSQEIDIPIRLNLELTREQIMVSATNTVNGNQAQRYAQFVEQVLEGNPNELLIHRLEEAAVNGDEDGSGLGLLTMITDYAADLGWQFEVNPEREDEITVTTSAALSLANILGGRA